MVKSSLTKGFVRSIFVNNLQLDMHIYFLETWVNNYDFVKSYKKLLYLIITCTCICVTVSKTYSIFVVLLDYI